MNQEKDTSAQGKASEPSYENVMNLKADREARGLSLDDLFHATRISKINIEAIENCAFERLPPPVYARDFIRKYAQATGIEARPLLDLYAKHLQGLPASREEAEVQKPWPEDGRRYRYLFGTLAAVIVTGVLISALYLYDPSGNHVPPAPNADLPSKTQGVSTPSAAMPVSTSTQPSPQSLPSSPDTSAMTRATPMPAVPTTPPPVTIVQGKTLHLVIETKELTWVRITEDRNPPVQFLLKPGDRIERMASDAFLLDIGNAGGIDVTFQGKPVQNLGKRGQVIHIRLPEEPQASRSP